MRIDKFLKVSRIIKRRTVASEACTAGRITLNGRTAKAGAEVKIGDTVEVSLGPKKMKFEILSLSEHVKKDDAAEMYRVLEG